MNTLYQVETLRRLFASDPERWWSEFELWLGLRTVRPRDLRELLQHLGELGELEVQPVPPPARQEFRLKTATPAAGRRACDRRVSSRVGPADGVPGRVLHRRAERLGAVGLAPQRV